MSFADFEAAVREVGTADPDKFVITTAIRSRYGYRCRDIYSDDVPSMLIRLHEHGYEGSWYWQGTHDRDLHTIKGNSIRGAAEALRMGSLLFLAPVIGRGRWHVEPAIAAASNLPSNVCRLMPCDWTSRYGKGAMIGFSTKAARLAFAVAMVPAAVEDDTTEIMTHPAVEGAVEAFRDDPNGETFDRLTLMVELAQ